MYGLDYVALRYFNVYGPRMDIHGAYTEVLIRWMERIAAGQPPLIFGDGTQTMDFVHVDDIARANILAAKAHGHRRGLQRRAAAPRPACSSSPSALPRVMGAPTSRPSSRPSAKVNPVPRRLADTERGASGCSASAPRCRSTRACATWSTWWRAERAACRRSATRQAPAP